MDWFPKWIQAYSKFYDKQYAEAARLFRQLEDEQPALRGDVGVLASLGQAQYYRGDYATATLTLQRVHRWSFEILPLLWCLCPYTGLG